MSRIAELSWGPLPDGSCRVRSACWECLWHPIRGLTQLRFGSGTWLAPAILDLGPITTSQQTWSLDHEPPCETIIQENRISASWLATSQRPVELHARWIFEDWRFWLEISLLTPTRLEALSFETRTDLGPSQPAKSPRFHPDVLAVLLYPRAAPEWAYLELASRREISSLHVSTNGSCVFRLFHENLEKGVVLRGRLLATFLQRQRAPASALEVANFFAQSPPNLSR